MKKQIIYVHGGDSFSRREDFLSYLAIRPLRDLPSEPTSTSWKDSFREDLGFEFEVFIPKMPNRENARYDEWKIWFERYLAIVKDGVYLVGLSLGGMFLAKYLSENKPTIRIARLYLLAAPGGEFLGKEKYGDCRDFHFSAKQAENITKNADSVNIWHSEDDFIVPVSELDWYQKVLPKVKITRFKDKNHFILSELPELISEFK